jgi:hypothetical protein
MSSKSETVLSRNNYEIELSGESWEFEISGAVSLNNMDCEPISAIRTSKSAQPKKYHLYLAPFYGASVSGLHSFGPCGQAYDPDSNKLYVVTEGVVLEADVRHEIHFWEVRDPHSMGCCIHYVGGPFLDRGWFYSGLADKVIAKRNKNALRPGETIERGLVIFDETRDVLSEDMINYYKEESFKEHEEPSFDGPVIDLPPFYWENPQTICIEDESGGSFIFSL